MDALIGLAVVIFFVVGFGYAVWLWVKDLFGLHKEPEQEPVSPAKPRPKVQTATRAPAVPAVTRTANSVASSEISGSTWLALGIVGLLLAAVLPLPIGFYTLLRVVVFGSALFLVSLLWELHRTVGGLLIAVAVLFNPIFPIWLNKEIWAVLNIGAAIIFLTAAWKVQRLPRDH
jgi:hypothetical protein